MIESRWANPLITFFSTSNDTNFWFFNTSDFVSSQCGREWWKVTSFWVYYGYTHHENWVKLLNIRKGKIKTYYYFLLIKYISLEI